MELAVSMGIVCILMTMSVPLIKGIMQPIYGVGLKGLNGAVGPAGAAGPAGAGITTIPLYSSTPVTPGNCINYPCLYTTSTTAYTSVGTPTTPVSNGATYYLSGYGTSVAYFILPSPQSGDDGKTITIVNDCPTPTCGGGVKVGTYGSTKLAYTTSYGIWYGGASSASMPAMPSAVVTKVYGGTSSYCGTSGSPTCSIAASAIPAVTNGAEGPAGQSSVGNGTWSGGWINWTPGTSYVLMVNPTVAGSTPPYGTVLRLTVVANNWVGQLL